ncbi:MAG: TonB-dependent siderophore receptor [Burkholderiaceae bacterium]|nr:TonB-dependent siderophore receptor [Burkholderiaceae bacterium]
MIANKLHLLPISFLFASITPCLSFAEEANGATPEVAEISEVIVKGSRVQERKTTTKASGFISTTALETPISVTSFSRELIQDLRLRQTTDAAKFDASINDAYNAVGYAEQFSIRGFALDNATSYRKDGFAMPGDAPIPLENKERIEILKGISGFQAGFAAPGGLINYVTKRSSANDIRTLTFDASERGTLGGAVDLGGKFNDRRFGYRINAAAEHLRSYVHGADGNRQFVSAAFDAQLTNTLLVQVDADYQHRSQITVPGFQLTDGLRLPSQISPRLNLNNQAWTRPVDTRGANLGASVDWQFAPTWHISVAANRHEFKRDDFTAFPYGCSAGNFYPGYCANGDFDVYDYQSENESKSFLGAQFVVNGQFATGRFQHQIAFGWTRSVRRDYFGDAVYEFVGSSNLYVPTVVPASANQTGPAFLRRNDRDTSFFAQDIIGLSDQFKLHTALRFQRTQRSQFGLASEDDHVALPSAALVFSPSAHQSIYASFSEGIEHGGVAPFGTNNQNQLLSAARSRQFEVGAKADLATDFSLALAAFRIKKPLELITAENLFSRLGNAVHQGVELTAQGKISSEFSLIASVTAIHAQQEETGDANLDGKRVTNVPRFKSSLYADYAPKQLGGVHLNASWQYASSKAFSPDNKITVPRYHVVNIGTNYSTDLGGFRTTLRMNVDNLFDRRYWRDVTQSLGGYLFPGAPRVYKFSAQVDF